MRAVAGVLEDPVLPARDDLDRAVAFEKPAHQVDVVGEHVQHRRRVRITLENREGLRARVVDARQAADDLAEAPLDHLLLGAQKAFLVAAAVADAQLPAGLAQRVEDVVGVLQRERRSASRTAPACRAPAPGAPGPCAGCSGVETNTALTSGRSIAASLSPVWKSAPV